MHSECQPPLTRVPCFRRAATPRHGLSEIPQGKSCAFRDKAYMCDGHLALLPASTTLRGCGSALQHPLPAPLPRRPLATSLLLAAIEMEPAKRSGGLRQCQADFQPTVRHADADLGAKVVTQFDQRDMKVSPPINAWIICASWSAD